MKGGGKNGVKRGYLIKIKVRRGRGGGVKEVGLFKESRERGEGGEKIKGKKWIENKGEQGRRERKKTRDKKK